MSLPFAVLAKPGQQDSVGARIRGKLYPGPFHLFAAVGSWLLDFLCWSRRVAEVVGKSIGDVEQAGLSCARWCATAAWKTCPARYCSWVRTSPVHRAVPIPRMWMGVEVAVRLLNRSGPLNGGIVQLIAGRVGVRRAQRSKGRFIVPFRGWTNSAGGPIVACP